MIGEDDARLTPINIIEDAESAKFDLLPNKSDSRCERKYDEFEKWRTTHNNNSYSESVLLAYMKHLSKKHTSSTLWVVYSMLKSTMKLKHNIDLSKYYTVYEFLKICGEGYEPGKSAVLTTEQVYIFLNKADDHEHLFNKVAIIIGVSGSCQKSELFKLQLTDFTDLGDRYQVTINETKTRNLREFVIASNFYSTIKKYRELRPVDAVTGRFFLKFFQGKCSRRSAGITKLAAVPRKIATFLNLSNPKTFTSHGFYLSTARVLLDASGDLPQLSLLNNQTVVSNSSSTRQSEDNDDLHDESHSIPPIDSSWVATDLNRTKYGDLKLLKEGFTYRFEKFSQDSNYKVWRCSENIENGRQCSGRVSTALDNDAIVRNMRRHDTHLRDASDEVTPHVTRCAATTSRESTFAVILEASKQNSIDMNQICGICVEKLLLASRDLLNKRMFANESIKTYEVLELLSKFKYYHDGPQFICRTCFNKAAIAYQFIKMCNNSETILANYVKAEQRSWAHEDDIRNHMENSASTQIPFTMHENEIRNEIDYNEPVESVWLPENFENEFQKENNVMKIENAVMQLPICENKTEKIDEVKPVLDTSFIFEIEDESQEVEDDQTMLDERNMSTLTNSGLKPDIRRNYKITTSEYVTYITNKYKNKVEEIEQEENNEVKNEICCEETVIQMPLANGEDASWTKRKKIKLDNDEAMILRQKKEYKYKYKHK